MRAAVWKFPLSPLGVSKITMPRSARILTAQAQGDAAVSLWAMVETEEVITETRTIVILMTGQRTPVDPDGLRYISTLQIDNGTLVYHVFEYIGPEGAI